MWSSSSGRIRSNPEGGTRRRRPPPAGGGAFSRSPPAVGGGGGAGEGGLPPRVLDRCPRDGGDAPPHRHLLFRDKELQPPFHGSPRAHPEGRPVTRLVLNDATVRPLSLR